MLNRDPDASLDAIAAEAGLSRRAVYGHFATRDDLIRSLLAHRVSRVLAAIEQVEHDDPAVLLALIGVPTLARGRSGARHGRFTVRGPFQRELAVRARPAARPGAARRDRRRRDRAHPRRHRARHARPPGRGRRALGARRGHPLRDRRAHRRPPRGPARCSRCSASAPPSRTPFLATLPGRARHEGRARRASPRAAPRCPPTTVELHERRADPRRGRDGRTAHRARA